MDISVVLCSSVSATPTVLQETEVEVSAMSVDGVAAVAVKAAELTVAVVGGIFVVHRRDVV